MGSHGDHRDIIEPALFPNMTGGFKAIHHRHLNIHEHRIRHVISKGVKGIFSIHGINSFNACTVEPLQSNFPIDLIVLHQQYFFSFQNLIRQLLRH